MKQYKEDISEFLRDSDPSQIISLIRFCHEDIKDLSIDDKFRLVRSYYYELQPSDILDNLKSILGDDWESYLHPKMQRSLSLGFKELILTSFNQDKNLDILNDIQDEIVRSRLIELKLNEYLRSRGFDKTLFDNSFLSRHESQLDLHFILGNRSKSEEFLHLGCSISKDFKFKHNLSIFGIDVSPFLPNEITGSLNKYLYSKLISESNSVSLKELPKLELTNKTMNSLLNILQK